MTILNRKRLWFYVLAVLWTVGMFWDVVETAIKRSTCLVVPHELSLFGHAFISTMAAFIFIAYKRKWKLWQGFLFGTLIVTIFGLEAPLEWLTDGKQWNAIWVYVVKVIMLVWILRATAHFLFADSCIPNYSGEESESHSGRIK